MGAGEKHTGRIRGRDGGRPSLMKWRLLKRRKKKHRQWSFLLVYSSALTDGRRFSVIVFMGVFFFFSEHLKTRVHSSRTFQGWIQSQPSSGSHPVMTIWLVNGPHKETSKHSRPHLYLWSIRTEWLTQSVDQEYQEYQEYQVYQKYQEYQEYQE